MADWRTQQFLRQHPEITPAQTETLPPDTIDDPDPFGATATGAQQPAPQAAIGAGAPLSVGHEIEDDDPFGTGAQRGAISRFGVGVGRGVISGTGETMKGAAEVGAALPTLQSTAITPYYDAYQKFDTMDPAARMAVRHQIQTDQSLTMLDKTRLQRSLSQREHGAPAEPMEQWAPKPDATQSGLYKAGEAVSGAADNLLPMTDAEKKTFSAQFGQTVGGVVPALAAGVAGSFVGAPEIGLVAGAGQMGAMSAGQQAAEARAKGASPETIAKTALVAGATNAALGAADIGAIMTPVQRASPGIAPWVLAKLQQAARNGLIFTGIGEAQEWISQEIAKNFYDPQAGYSPDVKRALTSLASGSLLGAIAPTRLAEQPDFTARVQPPSEAAAPAAAAPPPQGPPGLAGPAAGPEAAAPAGAQPGAAASPPKQPRQRPARPAAAQPTPGSAADVEAAVAAGQPPAEPAPVPAPAAETPVPPTVPEPVADIHAQIAALADPKNPKDAVFLAPGTPFPGGKLPAIDGLHIASRPEGTLLTTDAAKADLYRNAAAISDPLMAHLLGYPETKPEAIASGNPVVVQGTDASGATVAETLASPQGVPAAEAAIQEQTPKGGDVTVRPPQEVTDEREKETAAEGVQPGGAVGAPSAEESPAQPATSAAAPRLRTVEQIMREDGVGPKVAAATQADEIASIGRPITMDEMAARRAGVAALPSSVPGVPPLQPSEPRDQGYPMFKPSELTIDPAVMQFKTSDEKGVTGALTGFSKWEPMLANPITVWQSNDGHNVIVNGHQRFDLARRAEAAGQQGVQLPARVYREADGYTPEYMRAIGAYQNIGEGSGTPLDAARVLRTKNAFPESMRLPELPPHQQLVVQAKGLANLSPEAFGAVENGLVPPEFAGMVGALISEPAEQMAALDALARGHPANPVEARFMISDIRNSGFLKGAQTTLFGEEAFARSLVPERAKVFGGAMKILRSAAAAFRATVKGEKTLTAAGNVLATGANVEGKTASERLIDTIQRNATTVGPYSDALNVAARELAAGKPLDKAAHAFLQAARELERGGARAGVPAGDHGRGVGHEGEGEPPGLALGRRGISDPGWQALLRRGAQQREQAKELAVAGKPVRGGPDANGLSYLVSPDMHKPGSGAWRITWFRGGEPQGHTEHDSAEDAFLEALRYGNITPIRPYFGRRTPLPPAAGAPLFGEAGREQTPRPAAEPTIRTDERQAVMPGMGPSAVQAQAARDQTGRGGLLPSGEQRPANEGLFAPPKPDQKPLFGRRAGAAPETLQQTPEFKRWFRNSAVVDAAGKPLVVYHGTQRPDRVGDRFRSKRATSGPMAFFTDDPAIASGYAANKSDTSLSNEDSNYETWFRIKPKGARTALPLDRAWWSMSPEQKAKISRLAPRVVYDDDNRIMLAPEGHLTGIGNYDYEIKRAHGNAFKALIEGWLNGGVLFNDEEKFQDVLKAAGVDVPVEMHDPNASQPAIFPVHLSIQRPLDTSAIPQPVVEALDKASRRQRFDPSKGGGDIWDKNNRDPRGWVRELLDDVESGRNTHAWTSIPDWVTKTLRTLGYDGIKDTGGKFGHQDHAVWIPFDDTQVKSAVGNHGTFDPNNPRIQFGRHGQVPLYSAVERAVSGLKQEKGAGEQFAAALAKTPGVKPEEMKWLGLESWLRQQKTVTKQQITDYVRANSLNVQDVMKGDRIGVNWDELYDIEQAARDRLHNILPNQLPEPVGPERDVTSPGGVLHSLAMGWVKPSDLPEQYHAAAHEFVDAKANRERESEPGGPTKFEGYQLPGGQNYRELLITMPPKADNVPSRPAPITDLPDGYSVSLDRSKPAGQQWSVIPPDQAHGRPFAGSHDTPKTAANVAIMKINADALARWQGDVHRAQTEGAYKSPHWDEPNVLGHVRFSERTAPDGKRVLHIEELQSDWHQAGRKRGYQSDLDAAKRRVDEMTSRYSEIGEDILRLEDNDDEESQIAAQALRVQRGDLRREIDAIHNQHRLTEIGTPDAPFRTTWPALLMKRMIRYAVDNGFDRVAWTPGDEQAKRYDLSKQVDRLTWIPSTGHFNASKDGRPLVTKEGVTAAQLPDIIGKDAAQKLIDAPETPGGDEAKTPIKRIEGNDLKAGGAGQRAFYDKMLPIETQKIVGKFGAKVGKSEIPTFDPKRYDLVEVGHRWRLIDRENPRGNYIGPQFNSGADAEAWLEKSGIQRSPVHSFEITPHLRSAVLDHGLPLFQRGAMAGHPDYPHPTAVQAVIDAARAMTGGHIQIEAYDADHHAFMVKFPDGHTEQVFGYAIGRLIRAAIEPGRFAQNMNHEALHALKRLGVFTAKEWSTLEAAAEHGGWIEKHGVRGRYPDLDHIGQVEEAIADEMGERSTAPRVPGATPSLIARMLAKARTFMARLRNMLRGRGFHTVDDVFGRALSGEVGAREPGSGMEQIGPDTVEGSREAARAWGLRDPNEGALGRRPEGHPLKESMAAAHELTRLLRDKNSTSEELRATRLRMEAAQRKEFRHGDAPAGLRLVTDNDPAFGRHLTSTPEFRNWFGGSKVVDAEGKPLVVYHGTDAAFDRFAKNKTGLARGTKYGKGAFFFTDNPRVASGYAGEDWEWTSQSKANVMPVYLALKNPLVVDAEGHGWSDVDKEAIADARKAGHDGVILKNVADYPTVDTQNEGLLTTFIAFEPTQVKSAVGNQGFFDPNDPRIAFGRGPIPAPTPATAPPITTPHTMVERLERIPKIGHALATVAQGFTDVGRTAQMMITPMAAHGASHEARVLAKNYANLTRWIAWDYGKIIDWGRNTFKPDRLTAMWDAADADHVEIQTNGKPLDPGKGGVADLHPDEQTAVKAWQADADKTLALARKVGMTEAEGLPSYAPRMVVDMVEGIAHPFGQGGDNARAEVVHNILTLPLATMRLREAIAGRALVNQIKAAGVRTGQATVVEGGTPQDFRTFGTNLRTTTPQLIHRKHLTTEETEAAANKKRAGMGDQPFTWFTIKGNPAFWTRKARLGTDADGNFGPIRDIDGNVIVDRVPIYVRGDFEGPLKAIMHESGAGPVGRAGEALYHGMMSLKGRMMTSIMYGVAHLGVIAGRAFPAAPNLIRIMRTGNAMKQDPATMRRLVLAGMAPIGRTMGFRDLPGLIEDPQLTPGRSWTSKAIAFVPGLYDPKWSDATKRAIDRAGDFAHNTLLWDQVQNIQVGLALDFEHKLAGAGLDPDTATKVAANFANIYAGALPREAMSQGARAIANVLLFSRSYRLGNLAAVKAALLGLPRDMRSQIIINQGEAVAKFANSLARRKGVSVLVLDMALYYIGNSLLQSGLNAMLGIGQEQDELPEDAGLLRRLGAEGVGYARRVAEEAMRLVQHPQQALNPFGVVESLSALYDHEPQKRNRLLVGFDKDGTGEYMRNPTGKAAEDISDYFVRPLDTMKRMMSPFMRPLQELWANDLGFGHKVYDPMADAPTEVAQTVGALAGSIASSTFPWASRLAGVYSGHETLGRALGEIAAAGLGTSVSKGYPGGPELGELAAASASHQFAVQRAMPGIRDMIRLGKNEEAAAKMTELGVDAGMQRYIFGQTIQPHASRGKIKSFLQYGTPEQQRRVLGPGAP